MALTAFMPILHIGQIGHRVSLDSNAVKVAIISIVLVRALQLSDDNEVVQPDTLTFWWVNKAGLGGLASILCLKG